MFQTVEIKEEPIEEDGRFEIEKLLIKQEFPDDNEWSETCMSEENEEDSIKKLEIKEELAIEYNETEPRRELDGSTTDFFVTVTIEPKNNNKESSDKYEIIFKSNDDKPYHCRFCEYKTANRQLIVTHIQIHSDNDPTKKGRYKSKLLNKRCAYTLVFLCNDCDYKTQKRSNLLSHTRRHTGEKPFHCEKCEYRFASKKNLLRHYNTCKPQIIPGIDKGVRIIPKCATKDKRERRYACMLCDYRATQKGHINRHMRTHTGEKPFACKLCDYTCAEQGALTRHERVHTGEKPYACNYCDYRSSNYHSLVVHIRAHTGEKPFACDMCEYKCKNMSHLQAHIRTHTGEKPYACRFCDFKSTSKRYIARHELTKHTEDAVTFVQVAMS